jgi:hypothetical protein
MQFDALRRRSPGAQLGALGVQRSWVCHELRDESAANSHARLLLLGAPSRSSLDHFDECRRHAGAA